MSTDTRTFYEARIEHEVRCPHCHGLFRPMIGQLVDFIPESRFCSRRCRRAARRDGYTDCAACNGPRHTDTRAYGRLDICGMCRDLAWGTCWGKVVLWREPTETIEIGGHVLHSYRCRLCRGWHRTKRDERRALSSDYEAQLDQLAALIRSRNFNIDIHRNREREEYQ